jgi:hypothetical protein
MTKKFSLIAGLILLCPILNTFGQQPAPANVPVYESYLAT